MKRKLLFLAFILISAFANAQFPLLQYLGSDSTMVRSRGGLQGRIAPIPFTDTAAANLSRIRQYPGALIYTSGVDKYWYRNATATGWIEFTSSGGSTVNIYNSNGNISEDRYVDGGEHRLQFNSLQSFQVAADSITFNLVENYLFLTGLVSTQDTTTYKPIVVDPITGRVMQSSYWYGGTGGSGGSGIVSLGTSAYGLTIQNDSTYKADTIQLSTRLWRQKGIDSVQGNVTSGLALKLNLSDTASMLTNYVRRQELKDTAAAIRSAIGGGGSFTTDSLKYNSNTSTLTLYQTGASDLAAYINSSYLLFDSTYSPLGGAVNDSTAKQKSLRLQLNGATITPTVTDTTLSYDIAPTLQQAVNNGREADSIFIDNGVAGEKYAFRSRNVGLGFPIPTIKPTSANKNVAFDIMPTGSPGDYSDNGIAWIDVCDADVSAGSGNVGAARIGITSVAVQFGSRAFGTTAKPVHFIVNSDTRMQLNTNNTATFNIGKITQSQSVSGDYVGYTLLNTNNSVAESNPIFFIGNDFAANRFGYLRWNNGATSSGFREPNQLEIISNIGSSGGIAVGSLGGTSKIKFIGVGLQEMARFENYKFGILDSAPDSVLTVGLGAYFKRGVRMSALPSGGASADSVLVVGSDGSLKKRNSADFVSGADTTTVPLITFSAGAGFISDTTIVTDSTVIGSVFTGQYEYTIKEIQAVIKGNAGDSVVLKLVYNDSFNVDGTKVNGAGLSLNNRFTGNNFSVTTNRTVSVNSWLWMKPETVIEGKKPKYIAVTLLGYKTYIAP